MLSKKHTDLMAFLACVGLFVTAVTAVAAALTIAWMLVKAIRYVLGWPQG